MLTLLAGLSLISSLGFAAPPNTKDTTGNAKACPTAVRTVALSILKEETGNPPKSIFEKVGAAKICDDFYDRTHRFGWIEWTMLNRPGETRRLESEILAAHGFALTKFGLYEEMDLAYKMDAKASMGDESFDQQYGENNPYGYRIKSFKSSAVIELNRIFYEEQTAAKITGVKKAVDKANDPKFK